MTFIHFHQHSIRQWHDALEVEKKKNMIRLAIKASFLMKNLFFLHYISSLTTETLKTGNIGKIVCDGLRSVTEAVSMRPSLQVEQEPIKQFEMHKCQIMMRVPCFA